MQRISHSRNTILIYSAFVAFCAVLLIGAMFLSPSEPGSSILFGLSLVRLILVTGLLAAFIFFVVIFWKAFNDQEWAERLLARWFDRAGFGRWTAGLATLGLVLGWLGCFLPAYRAGMLAPYWTRLQPIAIFVLLTSVATLAVFAVRSGFSIRTWADAGTLGLGFLLFLVGFIALGFQLYGKYAAYRLEDFWYGAGVPILPSQLIVTIGLGAIFLLCTRNLDFRRWDRIIAMLLFLVTAVSWAREPLQRSFVFIGPIAPNKGLYPFADGATFDMASQFGLIGQGIYIFNTPFFERTLYISFLIYLHTLFGQNYERLMTVQAIVFAVFPVLIYLIGRSLNMRAVGFTGALIAILRGANAIAASNFTDLANPKMTMTDFPTAIGLALLILLVCEWLKKPEQKWQYALWVGGAIGVTLMLRTNGLIFVPLIPLYAALRFWPRWRSWFVGSSLLVFAVVAMTLPWELRNASRGAMPYSPIVTKIQQVLHMRYTAPTGSLFPALLAYQQTEPLTSLVNRAQERQVQACQSVVCFAPQHFLHDVVSSVLLLPTSPALHDLRHTVKDAYPYWRTDWDGHFTSSSFFFFLINLFLIALGIGVAWKRERLVGVTPLAVFFFYNLSNAFARTSGGRYIVPMDWIVTLYYAAGLLFLIGQATTAIQGSSGALFDSEVPDDRVAQRRAWTQVVWILIVLFAAGSLVPLSEKLHPARFENVTAAGALQQNESGIAQAGLTQQQVEKFLQTPGAETLVGRALYPRAYKMDQGELAFLPYTKMPFPRTAFDLIGPHGGDGVVLPGGFPKYFPHATDVLVIGCKGQDYVDALAVVLLDGSGTVYTRQPASELACPLQQPVCANNEACQSAN